MSQWTSWQEAIEGHDLERLGGLLKALAEPSMLEDPRLVAWTLFAGCEDATELLVEAGASTRGLLGRVVSQPSVELVDLFLEHGADPDERDLNGVSPLHILANRLLYFSSSLSAYTQNLDEQSNDPITQERLQILTRLVEAGADKDAQIEGQGDPEYALFVGATPLAIAQYTNSTVLAQALAEQEAQVQHPKDPALLWFLLEHAHCTPDGTFELLFLQDPAHKEVCDAQGENLLQCAVRHHKPAQVRWLLEQGMDPNTWMPQTVPPLGYAIYTLSQSTDDLSLLRLLLEAGADPNATSQQSLPPLLLLLSLAPQVTEFEAALDLLLTHGADPARREKGHPPALFVAAAHGTLPARVLARLLAHGAEPNTRQQGATLLHILALPALSPAQEEERFACYDLLLAEGLEIDAQTQAPIEDAEAQIPAGATPLDLAFLAGNKDLFLFLQAKGANLGLLQEHPLNQQDGLLQPAYLAMHAGEAQEVLSLLTPILQAHPTLQEAWLLKAMAHYEFAQYNEAIDAIAQAQAAQSTPLDPEVQTILASSHLQLGHLEQAQEALNALPPAYFNEREDLQELQRSLTTMLEPI